MFNLTTSRFNAETWNQRERWMEKNNWKGAIYCSPVPIKEALKGTMFVLEMRNDENKVKAIGLVKVQPFPADKEYQVYYDRNINRYVYRSQYRLILDQIELLPMEKKIITIFNRLLFKGACHLKRGQGIMAMPTWIMQNKQIDFLKHIRALFMRHYRPPTNAADACIGAADADADADADACTGDAAADACAADACVADACAAAPSSAC
jgi:hypothetical protein